MHNEERIFTPSKKIQEKATISGMNSYKNLCKKAAANYEGFWADLANELLIWDKPFTQILNEKNLNSYIPNNLVLSKKEYFQDYNLSLKTRKDFIKKIYFGTENKLKNLLKKYKVISNKINVCIHIRYSDDFTPSNWDSL